VARRVGGEAEHVGERFELGVIERLDITDC
jgi:hypothetical protein